MFRNISVTRFVGGAGLLYAAVKVTDHTMNDDWPETAYAFKKYVSKSVQPVNPKKRVVVLGSGWGALSCVQKLDEEDVHVTVISPRSFFFYTPLLAGMASGTVNHSSIREPIRWHTSRFGRDNYIQAECTNVDFKNQKLYFRGTGKELSLDYDQLVIAVGAEPATFNIPGVKENAIFMKEIEDGLKVQRKILEQLEHANSLLAAGAPDEEIDAALHWIIIGAGPTGVELSAELNDYIRSDVAKYFPQLKDRPKVTLLEATDKILAMFDEKISKYAAKVLTENGTELRCNAMVTKIEPTAVHIKEKSDNPSLLGSTKTSVLNSGMIVWAGGINTRPITAKMAYALGSEQNSRRGLVVDSKFRVVGAPKGTVYALGDCAVSGCAPTAQAAYQQGKYLGRMLRDTKFEEEKIEKYEPFKYVNYGALAYVGASKGVAELKSLLWDRYPMNQEKVIVEGTGAFAIWRSLYFSKLLSNRNKAQVAFDWARTGAFGRDISSPYYINVLENSDK